MPQRDLRRGIKTYGLEGTVVAAMILVSLESRVVPYNHILYGCRIARLAPITTPKSGPCNDRAVGGDVPCSNSI